MVTGGAGFLGSCIVQNLKKHGCENIFVFRSNDYDLRQKEDIQRLIKENKPDMIIAVNLIYFELITQLKSLAWK